MIIMLEISPRKSKTIDKMKRLLFLNIIFGGQSQSLCTEKNYVNKFFKKMLILKDGNLMRLFLIIFQKLKEK